MSFFFIWILDVFKSISIDNVVRVFFFFFLQTFYPPDNNTLCYHRLRKLIKGLYGSDIIVLCRLYACIYHI